MALCLSGLIYGGMEKLPLTGLATAFSLFLLLVLLYRFIYLRRIRYRIGAEQLVSERGVLLRKVDYMELYRIVDFQEHQSLLQQLCGLEDGAYSVYGPEHAPPRSDRAQPQERYCAADP